MSPKIDKKATGIRIRQLMDDRGLSVEDVREYLSLGCVQSIYHWLDGRSLPSVENLYSLSKLLRVSMDRLVIGARLEIPKDAQLYLLECLDKHSIMHSYAFIA